MSYDLIFGQLEPDSESGSVLSFSDIKKPENLRYDLFANKDVSEILPLVKGEIQANFATAVRLTNSKHLPPAERKAFGRFMKKWVDFQYEKNGNYGRADFVSLLNFREANKRFTERLSIFSNMSKIPLKKPISPPLKPPGKSAFSFWRPLGWIFGLGIGLGITGVSLLHKKER